MALSLVNVPHETADAATFEDFWLVYPRKEAKKDAKKFWDRMTSADQLLAVCAAVDWRRVWRLQNRDTRMIPMPATWLNAERWTDEVPVECLSSASHAPAQLPDDSERTAMPQRIRDAIAKLRK
jgi:hypothetical protein